MVTIVYLRSYWSVTCFTYCTHTSVPDTTKDIKRMCTRRWKHACNWIQDFCCRVNTLRCFLKALPGLHWRQLGSVLHPKSFQDTLKRLRRNMLGMLMGLLVFRHSHWSVPVLWQLLMGAIKVIGSQFQFGLSMVSQCTCDELWYRGELFSLFSIWILVSSYSILRKASIASSIFSPFWWLWLRRNESDIIISMPHFGCLIQQAFHWTGWLGWQKKKAAAMGMVGMVEVWEFAGGTNSWLMDGNYWILICERQRNINRFSPWLVLHSQKANVEPEKSFRGNSPPSWWRVAMAVGGIKCFMPCETLRDQHFGE